MTAKKQRKYFTDPSNQTNSSNKSFEGSFSSPSKKKTKPPKTMNSAIDKSEMESYVLWRRPIKTIYFFLLELICLTIYYFTQMLAYRKTVISALLAVGLVVLSFNIEGAHQETLMFMHKKILWCLYWLGLGVASSIGLGTGLHTFLLYLGPFIAQVTLAAYECNSLDFPEPPYPEKVVCPNTTESATATAISILSIMSKVRLESFMWGAGTAIGELPPYFMARASVLSAQEDEDQDEELMEFEQLLETEKKGTKSISFGDRMRLSIFKVIKKVGFMGILLCASIPNPLFDLAGITCGHFLVKFSTFFGATLIGKAIIKMHIQQLFIIFLFSEHHLNTVFQLFAKLPFVGKTLQPLFMDWLNNEKLKFRKAGDQGVSEPSESILSWILGKVVLSMVLFFVVSIVNSLAQRSYKRIYGAKKTSKVAND